MGTHRKIQQEIGITRKLDRFSQKDRELLGATCGHLSVSVDRSAVAAVVIEKSAIEKVRGGFLGRIPRIHDSPLSENRE